MVHHRQVLLLRPMDQILGMRVANPSLSPTHGPYHMKPAIATPNDAGVAHEPIFAYLWGEHRFVVVQGRPVQTVFAVGQMQAVFAVILEEGEKVYLRIVGTQRG